MQVIQINASYKPAYVYGGPTMSVSKLTEELVKAGIDTQVFTTTANGNSELAKTPGDEVLIDGVRVTYFRRITKGNSHLSPGLLLSLWRFLKKSGKSKFTIVHIHAWWNLVSVGAFIIAVLQSKMIVLSPRGTLSNYSFGNRSSFVKNIFHLVIGKSLLRKCHFHVSTEKEKEDVLRLVLPMSITIIPNFVELGEKLFKPATQISKKSTFNLLFLSRIEEKKGLDTLFKALEMLQLEWILTIAGDGKEEYISFLQSLALKYKIHNRISWLGHQDNEQKFEILKAHDLMILPSHDESFANVVVESLSRGTPVLVSEMVGLANYVLQNAFGWVFKTSGKSLRDQLTLAYASSEIREEIRRKAPNQIRIDFNDDHLLNQYRNMYEKILNNV